MFASMRRRWLVWALLGAGCVDLTQPRELSAPSVSPGTDGDPGLPPPFDGARAPAGPGA
jgi:hypothetical protein